MWPEADSLIKVDYLNHRKMIITGLRLIGSSWIIKPSNQEKLKVNYYPNNLNR